MQPSLYRAAMKTSSEGNCTRIVQRWIPPTRFYQPTRNAVSGIRLFNSSHFRLSALEFPIMPVIKYNSNKFHNENP